MSFTGVCRSVVIRAFLCTFPQRERQKIKKFSQKLKKIDEIHFGVFYINFWIFFSVNTVARDGEGATKGYPPSPLGSDSKRPGFNIDEKWKLKEEIHLGFCFSIFSIFCLNLWRSETRSQLLSRSIKRKIFNYSPLNCPEKFYFKLYYSKFHSLSIMSKKNNFCNLIFSLPVEDIKHRKLKY